MGFYCLGRISSKSILGSLTLPTIMNSAKFAQTASAVPKITYKKYEAPELLHHDIRNARLNRPMSPHLTIYAPQLTSMLSITHRITGMMLSGYITALGVGALVLPHDISHYVTMLEGLNLSAPSLFLLKAVIASPLGYHFANGLRHLYWDTAKGLTIKEVYKTGYFMLATSLIITFALAAL